MIRRPPRSTLDRSSAASDVYKRQLLGPAALGQTCQGAADMEAASRTSIESASQRYADMAVRGDSTSLQQNAIPSVASNFAGIESAIKENHANWAGAQPAPVSY